MSNGISFKDTDDMDIYERKYIIEKILIIEKEKAEAREKAIQEAKNKR